MKSFSLKFCGVTENPKQNYEPIQDYDSYLSHKNNQQIRVNQRKK